MYQFWITLLSIVVAAIGYLIVTFWFRPILRYRAIKYQVTSDLVFFADAIGSSTNHALERMAANRRSAADLAAINSELPTWYRWWLTKRQEDPMQASKALIGLSNAPNVEEAKCKLRTSGNGLEFILKGHKPTLQLGHGEKWDRSCSASS